MYIDYTKLWKLLLDKGMTKTDLMGITGISSRVLAKLSKNKTVTTDTIAKICGGLHCDIGDIMEYVPKEKMTLYQQYQRLGQIVEQNELYKVVEFTTETQGYRVYITKKSANKGTHIHCRNDKTVYWEQYYIGGVAKPQKEEYVLVRPKTEKGTTVLVLIKGNPSMIVGIDDNGFVSPEGTKKKETDVYVMTEAAFKPFSQKAE